MANLNVSYARGLFSSTNAVLSPVERAQLDNLRMVTQNFSTVACIDQLLLLTPARLANVPENLIMGDLTGFLKSIPTTEGSATTLACLSAEAISLSISNSTATNYTVFTTSSAVESFTLIVKEMSKALMTNVRPDFMNDPAMIGSLANSITESILKNVLPYNPYNESGFSTLEAYVQDVASNARNYIANNLSHYDTIKQRQLLATYMVTYYPYFIAKYIAHYIRTSGEGESSAKPSSFIVRQFAILTLKLFTVQILLLLVQKCGTTSIKNNLKGSVRILLNSIANEYSTQEEFDRYYQEILNLASENNKTRADISIISKNVDAAKTNVEKAVVNDQRAVAAVNRSKLLMRIWLALLIILIIAVVVFMIIGNAENNFFNYMYVVCAIFVFSVFINAMVQAVRTTST